jgi:hypothetical protein
MPTEKKPLTGYVVSPALISQIQTTLSLCTMLAESFIMGQNPKLGSFLVKFLTLFQAVASLNLNPYTVKDIVLDIDGIFTALVDNALINSNQRVFAVIKEYFEIVKADVLSYDAEEPTLLYSFYLDGKKCDLYAVQEGTPASKALKGIK